MAISFVAAENDFVSGTSWSMDKPAGTTTDDVMVMAVGGHAAASRSLTVPSGWTLKRSFFTTGESSPAQMFIAIKKATASEPSSYTFNVSGTLLGVATMVTYRGATGSFLAESAVADTGGQPLSTATVNNTQSTAWRITFGAMVLVSPSGLYGQSSDEVTQRSTLSEVSDGGSIITGSHYRDSNGAVATGNTSKTYNLSGGNTWASAAAWIGLLEEGSALPASGSLSATLGKVSSSAVGDVHNDATVAATLPSLSSSMVGTGQPIAATGTASVALPALSADLAAATDASGVLDATVLPLVDFRGETKPFGIRVIAVPAEDRTIKVPSRGVES